MIPSLPPNPHADGVHYASEKFAVAVSDMACRGHTIRERLHLAYDEFAPVGLFPLPEPLQGRFQAIFTRLTAVGTLETTLPVISDEECHRIARLICDFRVDLEMELDARRSVVHERDRQTVNALLGRLPFRFDELGTESFEREGSG